MIAAFDFVGRGDLPGELAEPVDEVVDFTPNIGGCGQALVVAALVLTGKADRALDHLDGCPACRVALAAVSDIERSAAALAYFGGQNEQDAYAVQPASTAA